MQIQLISPEERAKLIKAHRVEKSGKTRDRMKAVLLADQGWSYVRIAEALFIDEDTARHHVEEFLEEEKLTNNSGGSTPKLNAEQAVELKHYLQENTHTKAENICAYVLKIYGIAYTISGMTNWLHDNGFTFKMPKKAPTKPNKAEQEAFIEKYAELQSECGEKDVILFGDGVHPTQATKIAYGWILKGQDKIITSSASRTRVNVMGSIDLVGMDVTATIHDTINSEALCEHLKMIKSKYANRTSIHLILDQGSYNKSVETMKMAGELGITIHHLPAYSPNLNPIERLWKFMNEKVRNNRYFNNSKEFRESIIDFFENKVKKYKPEMRSRINDNFQTSGVFA